MDFPIDNSVSPLLIHGFSRYTSAVAHKAAFTAMSSASSNWPAAGQASYIPFTLPWCYPVRRMFWMNGSAVGGTCTIGLYTKDGANLYRSAATTTAGASLPQYVTVSPELLIGPGQLYLGIAFSGTTNVSFGGSNMTAISGRMMGLLQQSAIPAAGVAATFAAWNSVGGFPVCGFTKTASGF